MLCQGHLLEFQKKEMQVAIGYKMNPKIVNEKFMSLVDYIKYKLFEQDNKKLEAQWATKIHRKDVEEVIHAKRQMQKFDELHVLEVKERKWGWHPFYHLFTSI
jgi:hypothetical protein